MDYQIPKARQLYNSTHDINLAVIAVQKDVTKRLGGSTEFDINPGWWNANVGNNGTSEEILDKFDQAYARDFGAKIHEAIKAKEKP